MDKNLEDTARLMFEFESSPIQIPPPRWVCGEFRFQTSLSLAGKAAKSESSTHASSSGDRSYVQSEMEETVATDGDTPKLPSNPDTGQPICRWVRSAGRDNKLCTSKLKSPLKHLHQLTDRNSCHCHCHFLLARNPDTTAAMGSRLKHQEICSTDISGGNGCWWISFPTMT